MRFTTKGMGKEGPKQGREQGRARIYTWGWWGEWMQNPLVTTFLTRNGKGWEKPVSVERKTGTAKLGVNTLKVILTFNQ